MNIFVYSKNASCQNAAKITLTQILDILIDKMRDSRRRFSSLSNLQSHPEPEPAEKIIDIPEDNIESLLNFYLDLVSIDYEKKANEDEINNQKDEIIDDIEQIDNDKEKIQEIKLKKAKSENFLLKILNIYNMYLSDTEANHDSLIDGIYKILKDSKIANSNILNERNEKCSEFGKYPRN